MEKPIPCAYVLFSKRRCQHPPALTDNLIYEHTTARFEGGLYNAIISGKWWTDAVGKESWKKCCLFLAEWENRLKSVQMLAAQVLFQPNWEPFKISSRTVQRLFETDLSLFTATEGGEMSGLLCGGPKTNLCKSTKCKQHTSVSQSERCVAAS